MEYHPVYSKKTLIYNNSDRATYHLLGFSSENPFQSPIGIPHQRAKSRVYALGQDDMRTKGGSMSSLAQLVRKAYHRLSPETKDKFANESSIDALNDQNLE